jgi:eukaryotic-like serine/threonine-protein kinase
MPSRSRMPYQTQLRADDPGRVGRYFVAGRIAGIPSDDPIYLATGPDGSEVAISILARNWDGAARDRFAAEAAVAKRVPPFCAARVLDAGIDGDVAYLVSEYIPGQSLLDVVTTDGVLTGPDLEAVAIGMATGLASVHQAGLVHGHFGPEYAILPSAGPLRVVEFGITPPYGSATPSADMLAWAHAVFYAAAGRPPARMSDLDVLPGHLRDLVEQCVHTDPSERPTARAAVTALIGSSTPPNGILAEGSRLATRAAADHRPPGDRLPAGSGAAAPSGHAAAPAAVRRAADRAATSQRARAAQATGQRPAVQRRDSTVDRPASYPHNRGDAAARPPHAGSHEQPHRGRRTGILIGAVLVVVVLAGAVLLHLAQNSGSPGGHTGGKSPGSGLRSSPAGTTSPPPATPAAFAGTWRGQIRQPPIDVYTVSVTLATGAIGGTVTYSGAGAHCSGTLALTRATKSTLVMNQNITAGHCGSGKVTITISGRKLIHFSFIGRGPRASGTLVKS